MNCHWVFLSKNGADEYVNMFASGCGGTITNTDDFVYETSQSPIVLRGILKHKIMHRCWQDHRDFYYVDTGYFGNTINKVYHRVVKNDLQHNDILTRPGDRWEALRITLPARRKHGSKIIVAAPDEKPCRFYGIDQEQWIKQTVDVLKQHTDRPIVIRQRAPIRIDRVQNNPLSAVLQSDVHALVTFNSNAAVESILAGVPVFVTAPTHAASPVGNRDLGRIEDPYWPDQDKLHAWARHLAYGQFHVKELKNGLAYRILNAH
jgi:hypothetical protein